MQDPHAEQSTTSPNAAQPAALNRPHDAPDDCTTLHGNNGGATYKKEPAAGYNATCIQMDYLRFTLQDTRETWEQLPDLIGDLTPRRGTWNGWYDNTWACLDGGIVARCSSHEAAQRQGILIDLPSAACAMLKNPHATLQHARDHGHPTRVDFAADDHHNRLRLDTLMQAYRTGAAVTRWRTMDVYVRYTRAADDEPAQRAGWSLYFGSRKGASCLRIYDKAAETNAPGPWVRCELECKDEYATAMTTEVLTHGTFSVLEQIANKIRFTIPNDRDTNRRRWPIAPWWLEFLDSIEPGRSILPSTDPPSTSIENLKAHVARTAAPAMAAALLAEGGDTEWLHAIIKQGAHRVQPRHLAAVAVMLAELEHLAPDQAAAEAQERLDTAKGKL